ncbi:MAG: nucleotidyltransferase family protein [Bacillota bacterium]|nr:nucleotidyltransferase family protein [Bacillota bacterium]
MLLEETTKQKAKIPGQLSKQFILKTLEKHASILKKYGVRRIGVFGSIVRGAANKESDIDFLVELSEKSFDNYFGLKFFLEDLFGRKVDLVIVEDIKPRLKSRILSGVEYVQGL